MKEDELFKIYIEHWEKASNFLDKAILTLSTSILWLMTLSNIQDKINNDCLFNIGVWLIFISLIMVLVSYLISIKSSQLWISSYYTGADHKSINIRMSKNNNLVNILRYMYVSIIIIWIFILIISILNG
jgi:hypothetical protein